MTEKRQVRCAVYTRKSTEEGLEQGFNSLDAQREACEAYVASQKAEGWILLGEKFDDGGYSGGTLERPALQLLLQHLESGRIDVVVVYKIDRLSRSLMDFAKLVEAFDRKQVTFVSVTQSFNTTTSMGRLTLNVLLSFAQFEREVIGERIRDKFAASKKRGIWMGGTPPLGYDIASRKLVVNSAEAKIVNLIFHLYLELGCVRALRKELEARGVVSKIWTSEKGRTHGGQPFDRSALYWVLKNRVYLGQTTHKGNIYPGEHSAIVSRELFEAVQLRLARGQHPRRSRHNVASGHVLSGLIFDDRGNAMTPTYSRKPNGHEYHYYMSRALADGKRSEAGSISRIPAKAIEDIIERYLDKLELTGNPDVSASPELVRIRPRSFIRRVEIHACSILIHLDRTNAIKSWRAIAGKGEAPADYDLIARRSALLGPGEFLAERDDVLLLTAPVRAKFRGGGAQVQSADGREIALVPRVDPALVKAIVRAHVWAKMLARGEPASVENLAARVNLHRGDVRQIIRLAFLSPEITKSILEGRQRPDLALTRLLESDIPLLWSKQSADLT